MPFVVRALPPYSIAPKAASGAQPQIREATSAAGHSHRLTAGGKAVTNRALQYRERSDRMQDSTTDEFAEFRS